MQPVHVGRGPHGLGELRPLVSEFDARAHGGDRNEDVGEEDDAVRLEPAKGLKGDLDGEITLNVVGKFVPLPGGHPMPAEFTVKIQRFGGAGVGHWTLEVDGVVFCIETLDSGQIVLRRL